MKKITYSTICLIFTCFTLSIFSYSFAAEENLINELAGKWMFFQRSNSTKEVHLSAIIEINKEQSKIKFSLPDCSVEVEHNVHDNTPNSGKLSVTDNEITIIFTLTKENEKRFIMTVTTSSQPNESSIDGLPGQTVLERKHKDAFLIYPEFSKGHEPTGEIRYFVAIRNLDDSFSFDEAVNEAAKILGYDTKE